MLAHLDLSVSSSFLVPVKPSGTCKKKYSLKTIRLFSQAKTAMKYAFVTYLGTEDFLPGVCTLRHSLVKNCNFSDFVVLTPNTISDEVKEFLLLNGFTMAIVDPIDNPKAPLNDVRGYKHTYTKLRIFELIDFDKIIYLDADLLVCDNIEHLFQANHMSAVVAGSLLPENSGWQHFNTGVLVIEPSLLLFNDLLNEIDFIESHDGSDQGFLQNYFPEWPCKVELQLDHKFNIPAPYIDQYCEMSKFDFEFTFEENRFQQKKISIIHFWGQLKPWQIKLEEVFGSTKFEQAIRLWWHYFDEFNNS